MTKLFIVYLIIVFFMSLLTFSAYASDKLKAIKNKWRIKEKTLLLMSFLFGAFGGILAMYNLRHKNKHWYFVLVNFLSLFLHIYLGYLLYGKTF